MYVIPHTGDRAAPLTPASKRDRRYFSSRSHSSREQTTNHTSLAMSVQRSPPVHTREMSESASASGSTINTPNYYDDDEQRNVNIMKRKERTEETEYKKDFDNFRTEMMSFLENFGKTQNKNLKYIKEEISEIKNEIKTIKSTTTTFTQRFNEINIDIQDIKNDNTTTQNKIKHLQNEINEIKHQQTATSSTSKSPVSYQHNHNLILELKDRCEREKNIIIVGIPEINERNTHSRQNYDNAEAMKIITSLYENCLKPIKTIRLGKYIPNKSRPLKVCFDNIDVPKYLLRNKKKLQDNIQIYADQTPSQKQYLQTLKEELNKRIENGESDLVIKYIKGLPTITQNKTNQKNQ